jgi:hypothetical protein
LPPLARTVALELRAIHGLVGLLQEVFHTATSDPRSGYANTCGHGELASFEKKWTRQLVQNALGDGFDSLRSDTSVSIAVNSSPPQ